jgi:hypothetical protein
MCESYNGWINRETWALALHIDNDQGLQETVMNLAEIAHDDNDGYYESALSSLSNAIEELFDDAFSDIAEMNQAGLNMLKDIGSLYRVDWREVARGYLYEVENKYEEANA